MNISTYHDLIYIANITVGGVDYPVQLDTGSSDLFIHGETSPLPGTTKTYAIGWAAGHVGYAPVKFLGNKVANQGFLDATDVKNPALSYGAQGIAGLGFNRLSLLDNTVNKTNSAAGRSLLYSLFAANTSTPNFLAFALQRGNQPGDDVQGTFSIEYAHVTASNRISTWPVSNPARWNVLVDAVIVNNSIVVPSTKVSSAPSNKAVALMDSGSSYTYAPKGVCDAIYSDVPGASYDSTQSYWIVPCGVEINMALQIAGEMFPVHPLDVSPTSTVDPTKCVGSFVPQNFAVGNDFDWIVGDNFLRSVYSMYDFGDFDSNNVMGDPYMKLLSITDPDEASAEFHQLRGGSPKHNITFTGLDGASIAPSFSISNDISESLELIGKFIPAMLGIVALNALVVIVCCIVWLVSCCKKRNRARVLARQMRTPRSRMSPAPHVIAAMMSPDSRNSYIAGEPPSPGPHNYEPVSMALTEDTFVPPSPAFHRFEQKKMVPGDRPVSVA
ncbi:aspartic peptidase A1 [Crepidotus variabilis]|uniref:Aspartic peptidase A1 n=1 Tax=Crepidotus variabilis TaxID=179855 RepID=A0A9P6JVB2_9AGAR|nr:aspartic peptidase A1 [Crepidotus variabilis]